MSDTTIRPPVVAIVPSVNESNRSIFSVLTKRTYDIVPGGTCQRAELDQPLRQVDSYYDGGEPESSTVQFESEVAPFKLATDFVVIAKAYAPGGQAVPQFDTSVSVANHGKLIRVIGDRQCVYRQGGWPQFTDPEPLEELEIRYDHAYGGVDRRSEPGIEFHYPRNPRGKGLAVKNTPEVIDGLALPNLEDPNDLLTPERVAINDLQRWNRQPLPQGFGWYQKTWYPRCSFVGAVPGFVEPDEVMREEQLGLVPKHQIALARQFRLPAYDVRFNHGASIGLTLPFLTGEERVRLRNLTRDGELQFVLPGDRPSIGLDLGTGPSELTAVLHTVSVRVEDMQVDMIWRGAHEYPGRDWLPQMKTLEATIY
jgi:hypothetical protein